MVHTNSVKYVYSPGSEGLIYEVTVKRREVLRIKAWPKVLPDNYASMTGTF